MPNLQVDALLFDIDGTLVDESASYREALRLTASVLLDAPVLVEETAAIKRYPGLNNDWDATWALVAMRKGESPVPPNDAERRSPAYARLRSIFQTYYLGSVQWERSSGENAPFPWDDPLIARETALVSRETLQRIKPFKRGIATSRPRAEALMAVHQHDLARYFPPEFVVAMEDAACEKPDPAPLRELVSRVGCEQPVYIGDTVNDSLAAEAAGMPFIAVGILGRDLDVPHRVPTVNDIFELLDPDIAFGGTGVGA